MSCCDVLAFGQNDQYFTYLLFTPVSFQNCHLLKLRHKLAFVLVMYRFLVTDVSRSSNLNLSSIIRTELAYFTDLCLVCCWH